MAQLEVQLSADIRKIISDLNRVQKELKDTGKAATTANTRLGKSFKSVGKGSANAVPTLQEFSRVIQDAPFGIQGVANNITQLTSNFGNLSKAAGGSRAAFKLLLGSLAGPAGVLFAVSAITSLLVSFGDELFSSANKANKLKDSLDKINESFDAELDLNKQIQKSLELQGKSTQGILGARTQILRRQIDQVALLIEEQRELLNVQREANRTVTIFEAIGQKASEIFNTALSAAKVLAQVSAGIGLELVKNLGIQIDLSKFDAASAKDKQKERDLETQLNRLLAQKLKLENDITTTLQKQNSLRREALSPLQGALSQGLTTVGNSSITAPILTALDQLPQKFQETSQVMINISQALGQGLAQAFAGIGQAIGRGGDIIGAVGQAILGTLGTIISQMGQAVLQAGIAALALQNVFKKPGAAIVAGGLLIAIGSAISAAQNSVAGIGRGGSVSGSFSGSNYSAQFESVSQDDFLSNLRIEIEGTKLVAVQNKLVRLRKRNNSSLF